jgi:hypothetical protein
MDYVGTWRTNYVLVKPEMEMRFRDIAKEIGAEVVRHDEETGGKFRLKKIDEPSNPKIPCLGMLCSSSSSFSEEFTDDTGKDVRVTQELAKTFVKGEVMVIMEAGAEGMRYVTGFACAFNHTGKEFWLNINDIYKLAAAKFGVKKSRIIPCEY